MRRDRYEGLKNADCKIEISIHVPMRGTSSNTLMAGEPVLFQSTLPVRGATTAAAKQEGNDQISIRAPRAGSDATVSSLFAIL